MGCGCREGTCHFIGILLTCMTIIALIAGFVLLFFFTAPDLWYYIAIAALCAGALLALLVMIYIFMVMRRKWKICGCIKVRAPPLHHSSSDAIKALQKKDADDKSSGFGHSSVGQSSSLGHTNGTLPSHYKGARDQDPGWDPDTILAD